MSFERLRSRANRVKEACDLGELLQNYGYAVIPDRHREQQFACDLHGVDNKPSARFYGHNNTTYCWVCQKTRDPISYVMEKEQINFREAIEFLEKKMGLTVLPWLDEGSALPTIEDEIDALATHTISFDEERDRVRKFLTTLTHERDPDMRSLLSWWEVFDRVDYGVARESWPAAKGIAAMRGLHERVMQKLRESVT